MIARAGEVVTRSSEGWSESEDIHGEVIDLGVVVEGAVRSHVPFLLAADFADVRGAGAEEISVLLTDDLDMVWVQINFVLIDLDEFDIEFLVHLAELPSDRASRMFS